MRGYQPPRLAAAATLLPLLGAALAALLWPAEAEAQPLELKMSLPPVVFIVMDTSGSMAWVPERDNSNPLCSTSCTSDTTGGKSGKSRAHIVKEVMTGTFDATRYYCCSTSPPSPYTGSYQEVPASVPQRPDGVLDIYRETIKFAIAGFDTVTDTRTDANGQYSYAPSYSSVNLGLQNKNSVLAPLFSPGASDDRALMAARNAQLQERIRWHVSTGGTPIAAALDDAQWYFRNDPDVAPGGDDPYAECRPRAIILITDGVPTYDDCYPNCNSYPDEQYLTTELQAGEIYVQDGIKTYVVGFRTGPEAVAKLEATAMAGGTCTAPGPGCFFEASGYGGLRLAVTSVIADLLNGRGARTRAASTQRTSFRNSRGGAYELLASFEIPGGSPSWRGHLERVTYSCDSDGVLIVADPNGSEAVLDLAEKLEEQIAARKRRVLTAGDGALVEVTAAEAGKDYNKIDAHAGRENPFTRACEEPAGDEPLNLVASGAYSFYELNDSGSYLREPFACVVDSECNQGSTDYRVCANGVCTPHAGQCAVTNDCCQGAFFDRRYEAEEITRTGCSNYGSNAYNLCNNSARVYTSVTLPAAGQYVFTAHAFQIPRGTEAARMGLYVNGTQVATFNVPNTGPGFVAYSHNLTLNAGTYTFEVRFLNDSSTRDLILDAIEIRRTDASGTCNMVCYAGACEQLGSSCRKHSECADGKVCHLGQCVAGAAIMCDVSDWLPHRPLGAIHHSSPVIGLGPEYDSPLPDYKEFRRRYGTRDTVAYVGAGDGMLHAFLLGALTSDIEDEGKELWSFVPMGVYERLRELRFGHLDLVDATPVVRDVRLYPQASDPGDRWATVLLGGLRRGGRGWYALDVTDPLEPKLLWERMYTEPDWAKLGYTFGEPAVGSVVVDEGIGRKEIAVAFLPGGAPAATNSNEGAVFTVVDLATGKILRTFTEALVDGHAEPLAPITGSPAAWSTFPGTLVTRVYVGDAKGRLLRLDTSADRLDKWTLEVAFDPADHHFTSGERVDPVYFAPTLARSRDGALNIVYGNGDVDALVNANSDGNFVASVREVIGFDLSGNVQVTIAENWFTTFRDHGEKLTGRPLIFDRVVYFPTFVPGGGGACDFGHARLYAAHFAEDDGSGGPRATVDLRIDGNPDLDLYADFAKDTVIYGLDLTMQPACSAEFDPTSPQLRDPSPGTPQLLVQTGTRPFEAGVSPTTSTSPAPEGLIAETVRIDVAPPSTSLRVTSWGAIYQ